MQKKSKTKKVLYVITKASFGGAQKYVLDLAEYMQSKGHDVLVAHGENAFTGENIFEKKMDDVGVAHEEIHALRRDVHFLSEIKVFFSLITLLRREKPDIVHLNSSKITVLGAIAARIARVPRIISTIHGLPFFEDRPLWQNTIIRWSVWWGILLAHSSILISKSEFEHVLKWRIARRQKTLCIRNGIDCTQALDRISLRNSYIDQGIMTKDTVLVGTIAEMTKNKGLEYLIEALAIARKKNMFVHLMHWGDGELKPELHALSEQLGVADAISWMGFDDKASHYLPALDIFMLSSVKEGLPFVLLEAGCAGNAVIATRVGGVSEVIEHGKTGLLVESKDPQALADALIRLSKDQKFQEKLGLAHHLRVTTTFSLDHVLSDTENLYFT